jgi:hypothetical protein
MPKLSMKRSSRRGGKDGDSGQLLIEWPDSADAKPVEKPPESAVIPSATHTRRVTARLPVPRPLPEAVAAGHFGHDDDGLPIRPGALEVRVITERHAEKLVEMLASIDQASGTNPPEADRLRQALSAAIAAYAEDFGEQPARQLEAYARRQARLDNSPATFRR